MKRQLIPVVVALLVLVAGCAGLGGGGADGADPAGQDLSAGDSPPQQGGDSDAARENSRDETRQLQADRAIIRTGTLQLRADDFRTTRAAIADRARDLGGYVSGSASTRHTRGNRSWTTGYVVVRVPTDRFADALEFARDRGTVLDEETGTEDVSDRLVDLEARLENNRARRERLRSFYERANSTGALLRIEERLSSVQATIEQLEAEKRALEDRVAFATLRVEIRDPQPDGGGSVSDGTPLVGAFVASAWSVVGLLYGVALFAVRVTPYVLTFGLPALLVGVVARRRYDGRPWSDRPAGEGARAPAVEDGPSDSEGAGSGPDEA